MKTEILWAKLQFAMFSVFYVSVSMCHTGTYLPNSVCYTITSSLCQMFHSFTELAWASVCSAFIAQSFLLLGRCRWSSFCSAAIFCDIGTPAIPDSTDFYSETMKERQYIPKSGHGIKFWCLLYQDIASFDSLTHHLDTMPDVKLHVAICSVMFSRLYLHFQVFILHTFSDVEQQCDRVVINMQTKSWTSNPCRAEGDHWICTDLPTQHLTRPPPSPLHNT